MSHLRKIYEGRTASLMSRERCKTSLLASTLKAGVLAIAIVSTVWPATALGQTPSSDAPTLPSSESARSLLINNWNDAVAIHYARKLYPKDSELFGPYLAALHNAADWPVNQIEGATAFFRAEVVSDGSDNRQPTGPERPPTFCPSSGEVKGDDLPADPGVRHSYPSDMCFDDGGILHVEYLRETERGLPIQIEKSYAMVPNQHFVVVRYTIANNIPVEEQKRVHLRFAEVVDLENKAAPHHEESASNLVDTGINEPQPGQPINDMQAHWDAQLNAWIADMSATNGTFLVFGAFQDMERHRVFETPADDIPFDRAVAAETDDLDRPDLPQSVDEATAKNLGLALWKEAVLEPAQVQQYSFFYAVTSSLEGARSVVQQVRTPMSRDYWFNATGAAYQTWLQKGRQIATQDPGLQKAFTTALITNKQSQQPEFGSFVAATNPAYGFKVWPRDSSVTALGFTATGHLDEAVKFYRWMASVQEDGSKDKYSSGTWFSNYSFWIYKRPKSFVEPEWDSLGLFIIGVYHTWQTLRAQDPQAARHFLTDPILKFDQGPTSVYEAVHRAAEFISTHIDEHGFGPQDHSIWEEDEEFVTYTQVTYASGLNAARFLANEVAEPDRARTWSDNARRVLDAIHRSASAQPCPGLWNDTEARWNRATRPDCTRDSLLDAAADLVWVFGLVDASDQRADSQRNAVLSRLTPGGDDIGIARYEGDEFYHEKSFSPGGAFEAAASMPSWPQMDMYMSMLEHWRGLNDIALQRLQWYARVTNVGYIPPGEAVDRQTDRPLPSTAPEPVTASWYVLGLLNYLGLFDTRLPPLEPMSVPGS
jgi:hypothetical protein